MRRAALLPALCAALGLAAGLAGAAQKVRVDQLGRAFSVAAIAIQAGDTVQFANADPYLHQIFVNSPEFSFDSDEQGPGETIDEKFPVAGTFEVRCHIHPTMRLTVTVR